MELRCSVDERAQTYAVWYYTALLEYEIICGGAGPAAGGRVERAEAPLDLNLGGKSPRHPVGPLWRHRIRERSPLPARPGRSEATEQLARPV